MSTMTAQHPSAGAEAPDEDDRASSATADRALPVAEDSAPDAPAASDAAASEPPATIEEMRLEIDAIDAELVRLIQRRTALSHAIGAARQSQGGTRIVYSREIQVLERFRELGPAGTDLGMLLLSLGRGTLGRR